MGTKLKHYSTIGTNNKEAAEKFYDELLSLVNAKKFPANDRITMYAKAIELGASDDGEPGQRAGAFYGAYVYDLDGNKLTFFNFDV